MNGQSNRNLPILLDAISKKLNEIIIKIQLKCSTITVIHNLLTINHAIIVTSKKKFKSIK